MEGRFPRCHAWRTSPSDAVVGGTIVATIPFYLSQDAGGRPRQGIDPDLTHAEIPPEQG